MKTETKYTAKNEAKLLISLLQSEGFDKSQIKNFLCDGEALTSYGITDADVVDEAYNLISKQ